MAVHETAGTPVETNENGRSDGRYRSANRIAAQQIKWQKVSRVQDKANADRANASGSEAIQDWD